MARKNKYLIVPEGVTSKFEKGWRQASARGRIATLPEHAMLRIEAPRPYTPGKPWETYLDGKSPLWQYWMMNSSCLLLGRDGQRSVMTVVHGLEPEFHLPSQDRWFVYSAETWSRILDQTPEEGRLSPVELPTLCNTEHDHSWFRYSDLLDNRLMRLIFADALEPYGMNHRFLTAEFLYHRIGYGFGGCHRIDPDTPENRRIIDDPPILEFDFELQYLRLPEPPAEGALGRYLCLNNVINTYSPEFRPHGMVRLSSIDLVKTTDDAKFLVIV